MSSLDQLRAEDVRDAYRLIGECRDLGGDPGLWQSRLMAGVCQLVGGDFASGGEGRLLPDGIRALSAFDAGLDSSTRRLVDEFMREVGPTGCPIFRELRRLSRPVVTHARSQLVPNRVWYASRSFEYHRLVGAGDHALTSMYRTRNSDAIQVVAVSRRLGQPDFTSRQQQLMEFLHGELGSLIGGPLVSASEPSPDGLSPRLRQTLACLVEGDSEKQVAARLGLSPATAHQYVTALYRHFGVQSRAQLLAYVIRRLRRAPWSSLFELPLPRDAG